MVVYDRSPLRNRQAHSLSRSSVRRQNKEKMFVSFATICTSPSRLVEPVKAIRCAAERAQDLAKKANVDYNHFIRTSEPDHKLAVQHFWVR